MTAPIVVCARCGEAHVDHWGNPACTGHRSRDGRGCTRSPIAGGDVCPAHGGRAPQVKAAAVRGIEREKVERKVGALLARRDVGHPTSPAEGLQEALDRSKVAVEVWAGQLEELASLTVDTMFGPQVHTAVVEFAKARRDLAQVSKLAGDYGLSERQQQLNEAEGRLLGRVIQTSLAGALSIVVAVLARLDADPTVAAAVRDQWAAEVPSVVRRAITEVTGVEP